MSLCHLPFSKKPIENYHHLKLPPHAMYVSLREKIQNVSARCDNKPPNFEINVILNASEKRDDFNRCTQLVRENLKLIGKINTIQRTHGLTDNYHAELDGVRRSKLGKTYLHIDKCEKENLKLAQKCLHSQGRLPTRDQLMEEWRNNLKIIKQKATKPIVLKELMESDLIKEISSNPLRPMVYFNLMKADGTDVGRLEIVLFYDIVPNIVLNFIALCENSKFQASGDRKQLTAQPSFLGSSFYRIFPGLFLEGGDMLKDNGCGGMAADGVDFYPDNFNVSHHCRGTLAMIPNEDGKVNSRFTISFKPLNCLNGKRAAFGRVVRGLCFLPFIESNGTLNGKPQRKIIIGGCGLLNTN